MWEYVAFDESLRDSGRSIQANLHIPNSQLVIITSGLFTAGSPFFLVILTIFLGGCNGSKDVGTAGL